MRSRPVSGRDEPVGHRVCDGGARRLCSAGRGQAVRDLGGMARIPINDVVACEAPMPAEDQAGTQPPVAGRDVWLIRRRLPAKRTGCAGAGAVLTAPLPAATRLLPPARSVLVLVAACALSGCGLLAAPCRIASAGLKIVPVVGQVAAAPTDGCANVIDSTPTKS